MGVGARSHTVPRSFLSKICAPRGPSEGRQLGSADERQRGLDWKSRAGVAVKVRDVIRLVEANGWRLVVSRGSHRHFKHPAKSGRVTISGHPGDEMPKGTLASVMRQAGLRRGPS